MKPLIVAMTGATGAIYGIRILQVLRERSVEVHLVVSPWAEKTIALETDYRVEEIKKLAGKCYGVDDLSGGFLENVPSGVDFRRGTVTDSSWVQSLWQDGPYDFVYHLAAYAAEGLVTLSVATTMIRTFSVPSI
jgi:hypothetical protein